MFRSIVLDREIRAKWQNAFQLKGEWGDNISAVISSTLALGTLAVEVPPGYFLARQQMRVHGLIPLNFRLTLKGEMIKHKVSSRLSYITCRVQVIMGEEILIDLDSTLVKPNQEKSQRNYNKENSLSPGERWRSFSFAEIEAFAMLSGDPNPIHSGENPVVQGMLLLLALEDDFAVINNTRWRWNIKYLHPVKADEKIEISRQPGIITGMVADRKCFILNMEGNNHHEKNDD